MKAAWLYYKLTYEPSAQVNYKYAKADFKRTAISKLCMEYYKNKSDSSCISLSECTLVCENGYFEDGQRVVTIHTFTGPTTSIMCC